MSPQHVLIIGGGISGLAIAQGLKSAGIPFSIFEAEERANYRPRDWTVALHWSIAMLQKLLPEELGTQLKVRASVDPSLDFTEPPQNNIYIIDGISGGLLKQIDIEGTYMRCSRRKLRALCAEGIEIQWGHVLKNIIFNDDNTVSAVFGNGKTFAGTIVVGADGPRSSLRTHLLGDIATPTRLGIPYLAVGVRYRDADKARFVRSCHPVNSMAVHPHCTVFLATLDVPDAAKPADWKFFMAVFWAKAAEVEMSRLEKVDKLKDLAQHICEPYKSALLWIPDDAELYYDPLSYWLGNPFDTHGGRVTLAGDAAHPMPPNRGQACNHAINDALNFVNAVESIVGGADQSSTIQAYSNEMIERGAKETRLSKDSAEKTIDYANFKDHGIMKHGLNRSPEEVRSSA